MQVSISAATSTDLLAVKNTLVAAGIGFGFCSIIMVTKQCTGEIRQYFNDTLDNQYELYNDIQGTDSLMQYIANYVLQDYMSSLVLLVN